MNGRHLRTCGGEMLGPPFLFRINKKDRQKLSSERTLQDKHREHKQNTFHKTFASFQLDVFLTRALIMGRSPRQIRGAASES